MIQSQDVKDGVRVVLMTDLYLFTQILALAGTRGTIRKSIKDFGVEFDNEPHPRDLPEITLVEAYTKEGFSVRILDVCELDGNEGEAVAATPTPPNDAPMTLEAVAGDLLAPVGRFPFDPDWEFQPDWYDGQWDDAEEEMLDLEEEYAMRGAIPPWIDDSDDSAVKAFFLGETDTLVLDWDGDDDIQAGTPPEIEQALWDTARLFEEPAFKLSDDCLWCGGDGKENYQSDGKCQVCHGTGEIPQGELYSDTVAEIKAETNEIIAALNGKNASHGGRESLEAKYAALEKAAYEVWMAHYHYTDTPNIPSRYQRLNDGIEAMYKLIEKPLDKAVA